ncbi:GumC family protein [Capilliphycus salinus ALCB114379]|uniref:GumC family protein n=1 Tax=Capilliphycus salinus TaxID=2768948 RepID=UPI0039A41DD0
MATPSNSEKILSSKSQKSLTPLPSLYQNQISSSPESEGNDFGQILAIIQRRILLITSIAFAVASGMTWQALRKPVVYQSGFQLLVEPVKSSDKLAGLTTNSYGGKVKETSLDYETQIQILKSPQLINRIIENGIFQQYPGLTYGAIVSRLSIFRQGETKILTVRYQDSNPDRVKFVLDQLAVGYLRYSLQEQQTNLRQGLQFVDEQLPELINRVDTLQARLETFRQQYNFIDPKTQAQKLSAQAESLSAEKFAIQKQLVEVQTRYSILQQEEGAIAALNASANYQQLIGQIRQIETLIALESTQYRSNSPPIQNLLNQRQNLMPLLRQEVQQVLGSQVAAVTNELLLLQVRLNAISQAEAQVNRQLEQMPTLDRQYTDLQRDLTIATNSLNRFLEKRESLQIEGAQTEVPWQVLSPPARPGAPASNLINQIMTGIFGGLAAGIAFAFLLERFDNVFYSDEDIKDKTKLPILGVIPHNKKLKAWEQIQSEQQMQGEQFNADVGELNEAEIPFVLGYNFLPFLEAFRTLCTNIGFLSSDTPIKSFTISSPSQSDGKSTVAVHFAQAAAAMGNRVLLVDANLRLPEVHEQFNLTNEFGLSNLINTDVDADEVIQKVPRFENLFVLTAGQIPPDPTKLLSSNKMRSLMKVFCANYDWVIYDTPPCTDVVDSKILAPHTDGLLMVVRLKKTDKNLLNQALESLKLSRHNVLGVVVNSAKPQQNLSGYYAASPQKEAWTKAALEPATETHTPETTGNG